MGLSLRLRVCACLCSFWIGVLVGAENGVNTNRKCVDGSKPTCSRPFNASNTAREFEFELETYYATSFTAASCCANISACAASVWQDAFAHGRVCSLLQKSSTPSVSVVVTAIAALLVGFAVLYTPWIPTCLCGFASPWIAGVVLTVLHLVLFSNVASDVKTQTTVVSSNANLWSPRSLYEHLRTITSLSPDALDAPFTLVYRTTTTSPFAVLSGVLGMASGPLGFLACVCIVAFLVMLVCGDGKCGGGDCCCINCTCMFHACCTCCSGVMRGDTSSVHALERIPAIHGSGGLVDCGCCSCLGQGCRYAADVCAAEGSSGASSRHPLTHNTKFWNSTTFFYGPPWWHWFFQSGAINGTCTTSNRASNGTHEHTDGQSDGTDVHAVVPYVVPNVVPRVHYAHPQQQHMPNISGISGGSETFAPHSAVQVFPISQQVQAQVQTQQVQTTPQHLPHPIKSDAWIVQWICMTVVQIACAIAAVAVVLTQWTTFSCVAFTLAQIEN